MFSVALRAAHRQLFAKMPPPIMLTLAALLCTAHAASAAAASPTPPSPRIFSVDAYGARADNGTTVNTDAFRAATLAAAQYVTKAREDFPAARAVVLETTTGDLGAPSACLPTSVSDLPRAWR